MIKLNGKEILFEEFPNGETLLKKSELINSNIICDVVDFKYENDSDLIKLMFVRRELKGDTLLNIFYMPYSRMDRSTGGICFSLKYICEFINNLFFDKVNVVEPHSNETISLLFNAKPIYVTPILVHELAKQINFNDIMFPDKGAYDRYRHMFTEYNIIYAKKVRDSTNGKIQSLDIVNNDCNRGKNIVIVDDLSSYGGTFVLAAKKLREIGYRKIYLVVAHAEESILKGKIQFSSCIEFVYTTNSIISKNLETKKIKIREII